MSLAFRDFLFTIVVPADECGRRGKVLVREPSGRDVSIYDPIPKS